MDPQGRNNYHKSKNPTCNFSFSNINIIRTYHSDSQILSRMRVQPHQMLQHLPLRMNSKSNHWNSDDEICWNNLTCVAKRKKKRGEISKRQASDNRACTKKTYLQDPQQSNILIYQIKIPQRLRVTPWTINCSSFIHVCLQSFIIISCQRKETLTVHIDYYIPLKLLPAGPGSILLPPQDCLLLTIDCNFSLDTDQSQKLKAETGERTISTPSTDHYDLRHCIE